MVLTVFPYRVFPVSPWLFRGNVEAKVLQSDYKEIIPGRGGDIVAGDIKEQLGSTFAYSGLVAIYYWGH